MLLRSRHINKKDLIKKINYQLTGNFFSLEEAQNLSTRDLKKVIKLIAKIEKVKLSRKELNEIALFIKSNFEVKSQSVTKLWSFAEQFVQKINKIIKRIFTIFELLWPTNYLEGRFELMRN